MSVKQEQIETRFIQVIRQLDGDIARLYDTNPEFQRWVDRQSAEWATLTRWAIDNHTEIEHLRGVARMSARPAVPQ